MGGNTVPPLHLKIVHVMSRTRNICYTSWNLSVRPELVEGVRYWVCQHEQCPSTKRTHAQGYIEFDRSVRWANVKALLRDPVCHLEARMGTSQQAADYCKKSESRIEGPWEVGCLNKHQGKRSDLEAITESLTAYTTMVDLANDYPVAVIKYNRGLESLLFYRSIERAKELRNLQVKVYWGATGTGKTYKAVTESTSYFVLDQGVNLWFNGYMGEKTLIIDDFYGWIKFGTLLRILDIYVLRSEIKGSFTYAMWDEVIITSNKRFTEWYKDLNEEQSKALRRRIHKVFTFLSREEIIDDTEFY